MNWLAHVALSEPEPDFQLGNLLADMVRGVERDLTPPGFQRGCVCHQQIDSFAAHHPLPKALREFFEPPLRRFADILIDIFYDHYLARFWDDYYDESLTQFTRNFHEAAGRRLDEHPHVSPLARELLDYMIASNRFVSYATRAGLEDVLTRLSSRLEHRWKRPVPLLDGLDVLHEHDAVFAGNFRTFYPQLHTHVCNQNWAILPIKDLPVAGNEGEQ